MLGCVPSGVRLDGKLSSSFQLHCRKQQQGWLPLSSARASAGLDKGGGGGGHSDLESSNSAVSSASLPAAPKVNKDCNSCGGANQSAAIATKNGATHQHAQTELASDNKTSSFPGIISPPMKTVGKSTNIVWQQCMVKREERQKLLRQKGCVIWITGLSGSGKSTLACTLDHALLKRGNLTYVLDGDNLRHGLNNNLGFSAEDRAENIRRIGEVSKLFVDGGVVCIVSCISPFRTDRDACRKLIPPGEFIEVFMDFPLQLCEQRDPKGLYKLARAGKIKGFTGVDDPYEAPIDCEVVFRPVDGKCPTPADMAEELISRLEDAAFLG